MKVQLPETTTGAYARARSFVEQVDEDRPSISLLDDLLQFQGDVEELPDDVCDRTANYSGRIDDHASVLDRIESALEIFNYKTAYEPHVVALVERMDRFGFVAEPISQIAIEFNDAHKTEIDADDLEAVRRKLRDEGPIFGMCSKHSREFRHVFVSAMIERQNVKSSSHELTWSHLKRLEYIRKMDSEGKLALVDLYGLSKHLAYLVRMPRQLTANKVKQIMGCDDASASILHRAYSLLPFAPIV